MLFMEMTAVYPENHMKPKNILCGQDVELLNFNAGGIEKKKYIYIY